MKLNCKELLTRTIILYALVFVIFNVWVNRRLVRLMRTDALECFVERPKWQDKGTSFSAWGPVIRYYKLLAASHSLAGRPEEMIGYSYFFLKDLKLSQRYYLKAYSISPQRVWLAYNLGVLAYIQGDTNKAKEYFNQIVKGEYQLQICSCFLSSLGHVVNSADKKKLIDPLYSFVFSLRSNSMMFLQSLNGPHTITDPQLLQPVLHPWSYMITPCKEVVFN